MELQEITAEPTDSSLVLAAQEGDREAFGQLAERYERAVYATALRRLDNHAEAQEVCQEVLVRAMQKISQLREPAAFGSWLQAVTNRMAINRAVRKRTAIATEPETLAATCVERETPLSAALARERQSQVRAGLGRLGELDRDTLVAFYVQGQSLVEMSAGVPLAGRHDQAAAARRPQAIGQGVGRARGRLTVRPSERAAERRTHECPSRPRRITCRRSRQRSAPIGQHQPADDPGHAAEGHDVDERLDAGGQPGIDPAAKRARCPAETRRRRPRANASAERGENARPRSAPARDTSDSGRPLRRFPARRPAARAFP